jgi:hypothetical protein
MLTAIVSIYILDSHQHVKQQNTDPGKKGAIGGELACILTHYRLFGIFQACNHRVPGNSSNGDGLI